MARRTAAHSLLLVLLLAGVCGAEEAVFTDAAVRAADLERHVTYLASEELGGRETTTEGERKAAAYIAAQMERAGLEPGGVDGTFFQPFAIPKPVLGAHNRLVAKTLDREYVFAVEKHFNPFHMSPSGEAEGELVFAGYGITAPGRNYDDYAGLDVKGKVVLVLRKDPGWNDTRHAAFVAKLANAAKHGAAALLLCNNPDTTKDGPDLLWPWNAPAGGRAGSGKIPFAFLTQAAARMITGYDLVAVEEGLRTMGPLSETVPGVTVDLRVDLGRTTQVNALNVAGFLPGRDAAVSDEVVIIGGHFDHLGRGNFGSAGGPGARGKIHPGADDNASGVASVLEVAAYLAAAERRPRRSVFFLAFTGEEMGLFGSRHYVAHPLVSLEKTVAMLNLDMVGRLGSGRLTVGGGGTGQDLQAIVDRANEGLGLKIRHNPGGGAPSDSLLFFRKKIPVLFFHTGGHRDYHTPSDTADKIDYAGQETVTKLVLRTVEALADADDRLVYTDPPKPKRRLYLGVRLAGSAETKGAAIAAVVPGGPAAKAGMKAGDLIVVFGGQVIRSADDLLGALGQQQAGKALPVVVLRGESRVVLEIRPARRGGR